MNVRQSILTAVAILLVGGLAVWWYSGFTLDFMRFFAAEEGIVRQSVAPRTPRASCVPRPSCMNDSPPCMPDLAPGAVLCPPGPGDIVGCAPAMQTVGVGEAATLSATGGDGYYEWFSPEGARIGGVLVGTDGVVRNTYSVRYDTPGIKKVTVQANRSQVSPYVDSVACTVVVVGTALQ